MTTTSARFDALDGLRGLAAVGVAMLHFDDFMPFKTGHAGPLGLLHGNYLAVDFFFVLSGFVLAHAAADRLHTVHDVATFVVRRFGRLWPLHAALFLALITMAACWRLATGDTKLPVPTIAQDGGAALISITLMNGVYYRDGLAWNFPSWSISAEFWINVVMALVILAAPRRLVRSSLLIIVVALAVCLAYAPDNFVHGRLAPLRCTIGFFMGVLTQRAYLALPRPQVMGTLLEAAVLVVTVVFVVFLSSRQAAYLAPLVFALTVLMFAWAPGDVSRLLSAGPLKRLGTYSYSIYLVHVPLIALAYTLAAAWQTLGLAVPPLWTDLIGSAYGQDLVLLAFLGVVYATAAVTWRTIEEPGRKFANARADHVASWLLGSAGSSEAAARRR